MSTLAKANMYLEIIAEARRNTSSAHAGLRRLLKDASPSERDIIEEWLDRMDRDRVA